MPHRPLYSLTVLLAALLTLLLWPCGCSRSGGPDAPVAVGQGIAKADASIVAAQQNAQRAVVHADRTGKALLAAVGDNHLTAREGLMEADVANDAVRRQLAASQRRAERAEQALAVEKDHWLGFKARRALKVIVITVVSAWLVLGILGAAGPFMGWGSTLLRFLPFSNPFAYARDRFMTPAPEGQ